MLGTPRPWRASARACAGAALLIAWGSAAAQLAPTPRGPAVPAIGARSRGARPRGTLTVVLVRHGLYDRDDPRDDQVGKGLTAEGREQARLTASRLAHFPLHIDVLRSSTMTRARETAAIIADSLPGLVVRLSPDLSECTPPTERRDIMERERPSEVDSCRLQLERVYAALFRPSPEHDTTEVVVCHGNVTRYLVCRVLGMDPTGWLRFGTQYTSLTVITIRADGRTQLISYGDFGHLTPDLQTVLRRSTSRDGAARASPGPADSSSAR